MSGNRVLAILLAVAAGGFVYPLAAQQGPTTTQSTPGPAAPAAAGPQSAPQPQPDASGIPRRKQGKHHQRRGEDRFRRPRQAVWCRSILTAPI
jgi:hypothetical protein